jgi:NAD(P)-dependent dehydrogenase (short-subunit alcohol dehydrogenase family)
VLAWKREATGTSDEAVLDDIKRIFPMGRTGTSGDVADAAEFLVSDGAGFITGVALDIDGGAALNSMPGAAQ